MDYSFTPPPKLEHITPETLARIPDDVVEFSLIEYVVDHSLPSDSPVDAVAHLSEALRSWYIAFIVDAEVLNGGFNQLFFNPSGQLAPAAPAAFVALGIPEAGVLVQRALDLLEAYSPALEQAQKQGTVEAFADTYLEQPFSELDNQYSLNEDQWRQARIRFVRERLGR